MKKIGFIITTIVIALLASIITWNIVSSNSLLTESEIIDLVTERYTGTIQAIEQLNKNGEEIYHVYFESAQGPYLVEMNAITGTIQTLRQLDDSTEESTPNESEGKRLTPQEIQEIIEKELDETVTLLTVELDSEQQTTYLIKAEQENGIATIELDILTEQFNSYILERKELSFITEQEAADIALAEVQGEVDDIDLERRNGRDVYEIEIEEFATGEDMLVTIDALTGEVISVELD
ncbi:PepSY domain-containing protein [Alkalihalobacillus sp. 1P02AB]|uniref:PepSY domain-containing protein n=1 Tax=Alkalihalobacillus sp. 1P02AB TaxID=3132260 RepID=UPI0039A52444